MEITNSNTPGIVPHNLEVFERQTGIRLPDDYRQFLLDYNGGKPVPDEFDIPDCQNSAMIDSFFGLGREGEDLEDWVNELEDIRGQYLPIALDPGGNVIMIEHSTGEVYYWDAARIFDCSSDEENAYSIAASFNDLLVNQLH